MSRLLDRCLACGYDIESAADGWVLLRGAHRRIALSILTEHRTPQCPYPDLLPAES